MITSIGRISLLKRKLAAVVEQMISLQIIGYIHVNEYILCNKWCVAECLLLRYVVQSL